MRWGPGPVFVYECLTASRRWQTYALRAGGVAALLSAMGLVATERMATTATSWGDYASLGEAYFIAMIGVELALVMLAAPAATAGAICLDRARSTLAHVLMTDLSDVEIVLGKLAARLLPVLALVACTWPVMAISSLLGGIDPIALTLAIAIIVAVAVLGCTMALALSVWARKSHEVILATYTVFILGLLFWPIWYMASMANWVGAPAPWALLPNPFYVAFAPYADPGELGFWDYLCFFGGALGASGLLTILAVWRTRPVARRDRVESSKGPRLGLIGRLARALPGPSLDRNPVLWREWHRSRPSRWMMAIVTLLMGTTGAFCVLGAAALWTHEVGYGSGGFIWCVLGICSYFLHTIFGLLMLSAIAPTSMAEERQRGSLDILAVTTLSTREIVIGKWLGTFRLAWLMAIGPGLLALALVTARSTWVFGPVPDAEPEDYRMIPLAARCFGVVIVIATILAHGALLTSIGLALAVWIKRQSRAIAMGVGSFILITAVWPIVVSMTVGGGFGFGRFVASLSPVVVCGDSVTFFGGPIYGFADARLRCGTFWALEVFVVSMGLLWLVIRTFDRSFDRIPDSPRRIATPAVVVMIVAAMIGAGSLVGASAMWVDGVTPTTGISEVSSSAILAYSLAIAAGMLLDAVATAKSGRLASATQADQPPRPTVRRDVLQRWRASFCLVLLLAIGPALLALALATARRAPVYEPQYTTDTAGNKVVSSYVLVKPRPYDFEVTLGPRLMLAGLLIVTILIQGAAAVSVGLALATATGRTKRALEIAIGLSLATMLWTFMTGVGPLLEALATRTSFSLGVTVWPVVLWDAVVTLFAAALLRWTIWIWQRRLSAAVEHKPFSATQRDDASAAVGAALAGD